MRDLPLPAHTVCSNTVFSPQPSAVKRTRISPGYSALLIAAMILPSYVMEVVS